MSKKRIKSKKGLLGFEHYYDENGKPIGKSRPSLMGDGRVFTDKQGRVVGKSRKGFFAETVYHDTENNRNITTYPALTGKTHYENGRAVGHTSPDFFGSSATLYEENGEADFCDEVLEDCDEHTESDTENKINPKSALIVASCVLGLVGVFALVCYFLWG